MRARRKPTSCARGRCCANARTDGFRKRGASRMRAVIFDLWDTLVDWPVREGEELKQRVAAHVGGEADDFEQAWRASYRASQTGPYAEVLRSLGVPDEHVEGHVAARHEFGRQFLRLRDGARDALAELRR